MKRIIRFRGKRPSNGEWVYGHLAEIDEQPAILTGSIEWIDGYELRGINWEYVLEETVGQFTGLTDAGGKEIYENDIVQMSISENSIGVVKYSTDSVAFIVQMKNSTQWFYLWSGYKVVGNIHDNLSLLKGGIDGSH